MLQSRSQPGFMWLSLGSSLRWVQPAIVRELPLLGHRRSSTATVPLRIGALFHLYTACACLPARADCSAPARTGAKEAAYTMAEPPSYVDALQQAPQHPWLGPSAGLWLCKSPQHTLAHEAAHWHSTAERSAVASGVLPDPSGRRRRRHHDSAVAVWSRRSIGARCLQQLAQR